MEGASKETVVITGVSGYVGSQVCKYFLENGTFKVRGTVRNTKREDKIAPLRKAFGALFEELELVEADLEDSESIINAIEGCTYVVHTASPFPLDNPKHEDLLIKPAVEGTLAAMRGALKHKVKRVVITSSVAAIYKPADRKQLEFSVNDWTDPVNNPTVQAYEKSKTLAEKAAWDFLKELPEDEKFELATVNPGLVMGPTLTTGGFSSGDLVCQFITGKFPMVPKVKFALVDVRNVAEAHLQAILRPEAAGKRFMLVGESFWFQDMGLTLKENFGKDFKKCAAGLAPRWIMKIGGLFDSKMKFFDQEWGKEPVFINKETTEILGIEFIDVKQSLIDMVPTLIENGQLKKP